MATWTPQSRNAANWSRQSRVSATWNAENRSGIVVDVWTYNEPSVTYNEARYQYNASSPATTWTPQTRT